MSAFGGKAGMKSPVRGFTPHGGRKQPGAFVMPLLGIY
jgi:hypothetical protein